MRNMIEIAEMNEGTLESDIDEHVLLKEMSHRINNEYAYAINTISSRAHRSPNVEVRTALTDVVTLLMQYAGVHRALTFPAGGRQIEVCAYLERLCGVLSGGRLKDRNIKLLLVESEPQFLSAESCWKLGLAVSELITNSCRHAFDAKGGVIRIELSNDGAMMTCCVRDNGRNEGNRPPGQGLKLMRSLVQSVGGTLDYGFGERGAITYISMPHCGAPDGVGCGLTFR
jgi:two-component sensor histidine kinase